MMPPKLPQNPELIPYLYILSRLMLKAAEADSKEELIFLITNDTNHLASYKRAFLFDFEGKRPKMIGISGQTNVNENAPLVSTVEGLVADLKDPKSPTVVNSESFTKENSWNEYQKQLTTAVLWLPILSKQRQTLGLWLEQTDTPQFSLPAHGVDTLLANFLMHSYGIAWDKLSNRVSFKNMLSTGKSNRKWLLLPLLLGLAIIPVPLRITAPCEIISSSPYVVRAPLNGVIKEIAVLPGQLVKTGDPLFVYESEISTHTLNSAKEDVQEKEQELFRAVLLGMQNKQSLNDLNLLQIKIAKEKNNFALAEYQSSLLTVKSPQDGIVILDSPDNWRGQPVALGEKVLIVSDPNLTRIKIWIPESDNVPLDKNKSVKIYLNIYPTTSYLAKIEYIANEAILSDREIPSYVAKADWLKEQPKDIQLGLKGTAILYGETVPLFYYIIRKPWYTFRNFIGF